MKGSPLALRFVAALIVAFGFWEAATAASSLPAWQIAVLPAAACGFLVSRRRPSGPVVWILVLASAVGSAAIGEVLTLRRSLLRSARQAAAKAPADEILQALAQRNAEPTSQGSEPMFTRTVAAEIYRSTFSVQWPGAALCLALSLGAAVQAARMSRTDPSAPAPPV